MGKIKKILAKIPGALKLRYLLSAFRAPLNIILSSKKHLSKYKNKYTGKRCFIIGNGPSLKAEDLDKIKDEISFAANRIYNIFSQTSWRPTFYCIQDENMLLEMDKRDLIDMADMAEMTFIRLHSFHKVKRRQIKISKLIYVPIWNYAMKLSRIPFTKHAGKYIYDGSTVTYMSMQLAAYMGFSEIYLLGVDHNFPYKSTRDKEIVVNDLSVASHFYDGAENNFGENAHMRRTFNEEFVTCSYEAAEEYSRKDGTFRIYNATRGGKLEVFERVDLDDIVTG